MNQTITRVVEGIDYGHCLKEHLGFCHHYHGHRANIEVEVKGLIQTEGPEAGMVIDFSVVKKAIMERVHAKLDHGFAIEVSDPRCEVIRSSQHHEHLLIMDGPPTAENLAVWAFVEIQKGLPDYVVLLRVRWYETPNNYTDLYYDDPRVR